MHIDMDTHYTPFDALRRLDGEFGTEGLRFGRIRGRGMKDLLSQIHPPPEILRSRSEAASRTWIWRNSTAGADLRQSTHVFRDHPEMGLAICQACNDGSAEAMNYRIALSAPPSCRCKITWPSKNLTGRLRNLALKR